MIFNGHNLPYTDYHDLNLDWILETVRAVKNEMENFPDTIDGKIEEKTGGIITRLQTVETEVAALSGEITQIPELVNNAVEVAVDNAFSEVNIHNELRAILDNAGYVNVAALFGGVLNDGSIADVGAVINELVDVPTVYGLVLPAGKYNIMTPLRIPNHKNGQPFNVSLETGAILYAADNIDYMIHVYHPLVEGSASEYQYGPFGEIRGGTLRCKVGNHQAQCGIFVEDRIGGYKIIDTYIDAPAAVGIKIGTTNTIKTPYPRIEGVRVQMHGAVGSALVNYAPDLKVVNCELQGGNPCIYNCQSLIHIDGCHIWNDDDTGAASTALKMEPPSSRDYCTVFACDTYFDSWRRGIDTGDRVKAAINLSACGFIYPLLDSNPQWYGILTNYRSHINLSACEFRNIYNIAPSKLYPVSIYNVDNYAAGVNVDKGMSNIDYNTIEVNGITPYLDISHQQGRAFHALQAPSPTDNSPVVGRYYEIARIFAPVNTQYPSAHANFTVKTDNGDLRLDGEVTFKTTTVNSSGTPTAWSFTNVSTSQEMRRTTWQFVIRKPRAIGNYSVVSVYARFTEGTRNFTGVTVTAESSAWINVLDGMSNMVTSIPAADIAAVYGSTP